MRHRKKDVSDRFLWYWLGSSLSVWVYILTLSIVAWLPISLPLRLITQGSGPLAAVLLIVLVVLVPGCIIGYCIGQVQSRLLARRLDWPIPDWTQWSVIGGIVGAVLVMGGGAAFGLAADRLLFWAMPVFAFCLGFAQCIPLSDRSSAAWLWVLANTVGGLVFSGLLFMNQPDPYASHYVLRVIGLWVLAALAQGAITGYVILWLYENTAPDDIEEFPPYWDELDLD